MVWNEPGNLRVHVFSQTLKSAGQAKPSKGAPFPKKRVRKSKGERKGRTDKRGIKNSSVWRKQMVPGGSKNDTAKLCEHRGRGHQHYKLSFKVHTSKGKFN